MSRVDCLTRTRMIGQALEHILKEDPAFPYTMEEYEQAKAVRETVFSGRYPEKWTQIAEAVDDWLNEHYDMFELDYTHFDDEGSRDIVILCYTKRFGAFESPDFATELPKLVVYR